MVKHIRGRTWGSHMKSPATPEIYLDNNASTRALESVATAMLSVLTEDHGNPSSPHARGARARAKLEAARQNIAGILHCEPDKPEQVIFTSGATEANDMVLRDAIGKSENLICTEAEHPFIMQAVENSGTGIFIPVDDTGVMDLSALEAVLRKTCPDALIVTHWAHGETGVIQPVAKICRLAAEYRARTLFDATQAMGRVSSDDLDLPYDLLSFSGHKIHASQGIGVLHVKSDYRLSNVQDFQEFGFRPGTENTPGIVGLGQACADIYENFQTHCITLTLLRDAFEYRLVEKMPNVIINGGKTPRIPNTSNITFPGIDGMTLAIRLEQRGILCSRISACRSARPIPSDTLLAMGRSEEDAFSSLRFSFSILNSMEEALKAAEYVIEEVCILRRLFQ